MTIYKLGPNGQLVDPTYKPKRKNHPNRRALAGNGPIGRRWRRVRKHYLALHPTCAVHEGHALATHVHHLDGLGPTGPRGFDWSNLESLCHSCHSRETARMQPSGWAA